MNMKKIYFLLISATLLFSNCNKDDAILFEMKYFADFTIDAGLNPFSGTHIYEINNIKSNYDDYLSQNTTTNSTINIINPGESFLAAIFGGSRYDYVNELSVKIFSLDDPDFEKEIFYHNLIPENQSGTLNIIPTLVDVKEFLEKDAFSIRVEFKLREFSPETVETRIEFSFFAK